MRPRVAVLVLALLVVLPTPRVVAEERAEDSYHVPPMSGVWWLSKASRFSQAPDPALASTCKSFIDGGGNPYRRRVAPNVNQIVDDAVNTGVGPNHGCHTPQNETSLAVDPADPQHLVAGANDYRFVNPTAGRNDGSGGHYFSFDGGRTWGNGFLPGLVKGNSTAPGPFDGAGDPVVAFGPDGTVYYSNIAFNRTTPENGVFVNASTDGGRTFGPPGTVTYTEDPTLFNDKEWMAVDNSPLSPHRGTVYVTWTKFEFTPGGTYLRSPIVLARSTDGGRTFSEPVPVSLPNNQYNQFSVPVIGPRGEVYVTFQNWPTLTSVNSQNMVAVSSDGGRSFARNVRISNNVDFPYNPDTGRSSLTGQTFRVNSGPATAIRLSDGMLFTVWADNRNGAATATNGDVFLSRSADGGLTWTGPQKVNTETGKHDQFFPWVAVGGDGSVHVGFYDRQYVVGGDSADDAYLDYAYARSSDGRTFAATERITTEASDPNTQFDGLFIGDYTAVAADVHGNAHLSWTDSRGRPGTTPPNQDAYHQKVGAAKRA